MKIVKYVFLLLLLSVIALTVFIATQEGKYDIQKERVIEVPKAVLYNYINDYTNWETTDLLTGNDTTAVYSFSQNTSGPGAVMNWDKGNTTGEVKTIRVVENDSILQEANIDGHDSKLQWGFKDTLNSTKVTIKLRGELTFKEKAYMLLKGNVNDNMSIVLDKGLDNLDNYLVKELSVYNIKVADGKFNKAAAFFIGQPVTSKMSEINKKAAEIFPKLYTFIKENKIVKKGSPFILYRTFNNEAGTATYVIALPIRDEIHTMAGSEYEGGRITQFEALKTTLTGDYSHLPEAWSKARKHIADKGLQENTTGQYVELYTKNVQTTKRPSQWVTDIFIPLGAPTITPMVDSLSRPIAPTVRRTTPVTTGARTSTPSAVKPVGINPGTKPATTSTGTTKPATTATSKPAGTNGNGTPANKPTATTPKPAAPKPTGIKPSTNP